MMWIEVRRLYLMVAMVVLSNVASAQEPARDDKLKGKNGYVGARLKVEGLKMPLIPPDFIFAEKRPTPTDMSICVDQSGVATSVDIVGSSGYKTLDDLAAAWALKSPYRAAEQGGHKMPVCGYMLEFDWLPPASGDAPPPTPASPKPK